jgi:hypothetical protein
VLVCIGSAVGVNGDVSVGESVALGLAVFVRVAGMKGVSVGNIPVVGVIRGASSEIDEQPARNNIQRNKRFFAVHLRNFMMVSLSPTFAGLC